MEIVYRSPKSEKEFENYFKVRWKLLRKPLGFAQGSEQDDLENTAFHIAAFINEKIIGVARFQIENDSTARIRFMAVDYKYRKQGIGSRLLKELENIAKTKGVKNCWLYARETAAVFYLKNDYIINGVADSELATKHQRMEKALLT